MQTADIESVSEDIRQGDETVRGNPRYEKKKKKAIRTNLNSLLVVHIAAGSFSFFWGGRELAVGSCPANSPVARQTYVGCGGEDGLRLILPFINEMNTIYIHIYILIVS